MRQIFLVFPFFGPQSKKMKLELEKLTKYFPCVHFNIILVNNFWIGCFFHYKDKLPSAGRSSLVYSYRCAKCASQDVGMTARTLRTRVFEHCRRLALPPLLFFVAQATFDGCSQILLWIHAGGRSFSLARGLITFLALLRYPSDLVVTLIIC